jgi:hypothetical protein
LTSSNQYRSQPAAGEPRSDTFYFVRDYVAPLVNDNVKWYEARGMVQVVAKLAASKLAVA